MSNISIIQSENIDKQKIEITVTVIIATYRRDTSLKKSIETVINQSYNNLEIIVVDDNAEINWNQKVLEIINTMRLMHPIIYIQNQTNKGSAETRNIGIKKSTGSYITFLDDDDLYLIDKVQNQLKHMLDNKSDYSITDMDLFDENNRLIERRTRKYIRDKNKDDLLKYNLMYHMTGTNSLMFRRDYLISINGFPPLDIGDEFYLMQRAIEAGGIFSYLPISDIKAYVHTEADGLSSGDIKINGENQLYEYKKQFFTELGYREISYIKMRHYAVLAYTEWRRKKIRAFVKYSALSFLSSPFGCLSLIIDIIKSKHG